MTKLLLAVAFCAAFAASSNAQTSSSIPPRDPPFGKGIPDNDSLHQPSATGAIAQTAYPVPPRDPPFGKGGFDNNTEREPNRNSAADESIPPRDPPFGKGSEPAHLPSSTVTQSELPKNAKKEARTKSALKKDNPKGSTKHDGAPASDTN